MSCGSWLHQLRPEIKAGPLRDQWTDIRQPQHRPATRKQTSKTRTAGLYDLAGCTKFHAHKKTQEMLLKMVQFEFTSRALRGVVVQQGLVERLYGKTNFSSHL